MRVLPVMLVVLAACSAPPRSSGTTGRTTGRTADAGAFVRRQWSALAGDGTWRCVVVDSADAWRTERERLGAVDAAPPADWCAFASERMVVVQMPGSLEPPVSWHVSDEEDVDVLTLIPQRAAAAGAPARVLLLAVAARRAELAIVARVPDASGRFTETTLGVFAGR